MNVPPELKYANSHEWCRLEGDLVTVGISDHAQAELTSVVYLELPKTGRKVKAKESVAVIESVKSANDIYAPVAGEIVEVNGPLADDPGGINTDPYGAGWMVKLELSSPGELDNLMDSVAYTKYLGTL